MRIAWIAWSMLVFAGALPVARGADVCKPDLITEVDLHVGRNGTVFLPATVNGHDVYFVLDIASGLPMVFDSAVQELGLVARPRVGGAEMVWDGKRVSQYAKLAELRVGTFELLSRNAPVIPLNPRNAMPAIDGRPIVGIMGSTLIQHVDAELFLAGHKLRLFEPVACRNGTPVYWGAAAAALPMHWDQAGTLVFILELNGKRIEASLLAGNGVSTIDLNAAREFFGIDDAAGGQAFHPMSLTGTGIEIQDAPVQLRPGPCKVTRSTPGYGAIGYARCVNAVPFNLGTDLLSQLRVYISNKQKTVYVTRVDPAADGAGGDVAIAPGQ